MLREIVIGSIEIKMYDFMYVVGFVGMFLICMLTKNRYKTNTIRAITYTLVTFVFGVAGAKLMGELYTYTMIEISKGSYDPNSGVCIFGALMFLPVFMGILAVGSREKYRKLMDYMTPGIFFILGCAKLGCLLEGCCYGIPAENGVYNRHLDYLVFPVQFYESICTFVVVAILVFIMIKRGNIRYGSLYPIGTILYCICRIIWENYRHYEQDIEFDFLFSLTYWQHWAIIAVTVSVIWLVVLYSSEKYRKCELEFKIIKIKDSVNFVEKEVFDRKRNKHALKAKQHKQKEKELKQKMKK